MIRTVKILSLSVLMALLVCPAVVSARPAPKDGVVREYHPNGKRRLERTYKHGQLLRHRTFYENGRAMQDMRYKDGALYQIKTFYDSGRLKSIWKKKTMTTDYYEENGKLKASIHTGPIDIKKRYPSSYIGS